MRVGLLTVSDRASQGVYSDESGPEMARLLEEMGAFEIMNELKKERKKERKQ